MIERVTELLAPSGLNLVGVATASDYDARVRGDLRLAERAPWVRSAIVVGNGGGAFWQRMADWAEGSRGVEAKADPVDEFTVAAVEGALSPLLAASDTRHRIVYPFRFADDPLSFVDLAAAAGLGSPSLLRVLVHPVYGPWMALRAAVLVDVPLTAARPASGFDPCPTCIERSCIAACPGDAVDGEAGWRFTACVSHRQRTGDCESRCAARFECVLGREHRYPDDELAHHHRRAWRIMKAWS